MARIDNLTNFLIDVAKAIKSKTGKSTNIPAESFDTEIMTIETGGTYQSKTVTILDNGDKTIVPDQGYDAIDQIVIQTRVPVKTLQTKSMQITSNMNIEIEPDASYDGFSKLSLEVNVPSSGGNLQEKDITITTTETQTIRPDSGYDGMSKVNLQFDMPQGAKLYPTLEQMYADEDIRNQDFGAVYSNDFSPIVGRTVGGVIRFPGVVVLDTPLENAYLDIRNWESGYLDVRCDTASDTMVNIRGFGYGPTGEIDFDITYTSTDGLTYISDNGDYDIEVPDNSDIYAEGGLEYFALQNSCYFGGIYQVQSIDNPNKPKFAIVPSTLTTSYPYIDRCENTTDISNVDKSAEAWIIVMNQYEQVARNYTLYKQTVANKRLLLSRTYNTLLLAFIGAEDYSDGDVVIKETYVDGVLTNTETIDLSTCQPVHSSPQSVRYVADITGKVVYSSADFSMDWYCYKSETSLPLETYGGGSNQLRWVYDKMLHYEPANTQLTLDNANQLLPNVEAYGKTGIIKGDGSIYNNLTWSTNMLENCPTDVFLEYMNKPHANNLNSLVVFDDYHKPNIEYGVDLTGSTLYTLAYSSDTNVMKRILGNRIQYASFNICKSYIIGTKLYTICIDYQASSPYSYNIFVVIYDTSSNIYEINTFNSVENNVSVGDRWLHSGSVDTQLSQDGTYIMLYTNIVKSSYASSSTGATYYMNVIEYNISTGDFAVLTNYNMSSVVTPSSNTSVYSQSAWRYGNNIYFSHSELINSYTYNRLECINISTGTSTNVYTKSISGVWKLPRFVPWISSHKICIDDNICYFLKYSGSGTATLAKLNMNTNGITDLRQVPVSFSTGDCGYETYAIRKEGDYLYLATYFRSKNNTNTDKYMIHIFKYSISNNTFTQLYTVMTNDYYGDDGNTSCFMKSQNHLYFVSSTKKVEITNDTAVELPSGKYMSASLGDCYDVNGITYNANGYNCMVYIGDGQIVENIDTRFTVLCTSSDGGTSRKGKVCILYNVSDGEVILDDN